MRKSSAIICIIAILLMLFLSERFSTTASPERGLSTQTPTATIKATVSEGQTVSYLGYFPQRFPDGYIFMVTPSAATQSSVNYWPVYYFNVGSRDILVVKEDGLNPNNFPDKCVLITGKVHWITDGEVRFIELESIKSQSALPTSRTNQLAKIGQSVTITGFFTQQIDIKNRPATLAADSDPFQYFIGKTRVIPLVNFEVSVRLGDWVIAVGKVVEVRQGGIPDVVEVESMQSYMCKEAIVTPGK